MEKAMFREMTEATVEDQEEITRRVNTLVSQGLSQVQAILVDEAYRKTLKTFIEALDKNTIEGVTPELLHVAITYTVAGMRVYLEGVTEMLQDIAIAMVRPTTEPTPGCGCDVCTRLRAQGMQGPTIN